MGKILDWLVVKVSQAALPDKRHLPPPKHRKGKKDGKK